MSTLTAPQSVAESELAEEERQRKIWDYYEQEVLKALESDVRIPGTPEFWEKLRKEVHQRRESRKTSAALKNP